MPNVPCAADNPVTINLDLKMERHTIYWLRDVSKRLGLTIPALLVDVLIRAEEGDQRYAQPFAPRR